MPRCNYFARLPLGLLLAVAVVCTSCGKTSPKTGSGEPSAQAGKSSEDALRDRLDAALEFTCQNRRLDVSEQNAWQIIHGALAFGKDFTVLADGKDVSVIEYAMSGGKMNGWNLEKGDLLDAKTGRYGVRAKVEPGTMAGQGHSDQWMGYLADCHLKPDQEIIVEGEKRTLEDYIRQIELDVYRAHNREFSWTLMGLTAYRPSKHYWVAGDGTTWSIEKMVEEELSYNTDESPCGGTHRLYGLTMARNRHLAGGGQLTGIWKKCDDRIRAEVERAKQSLNPDGSLSSRYLERPASHPDITAWMVSAGHVFEFLSAAVTDEQLHEPWMQTAALRLCEQFEKTKHVEVECDRLFHAAHGLVVFRNRAFGPKTYGSAKQ